MHINVAELEFVIIFPKIIIIIALFFMQSFSIA